MKTQTWWAAGQNWLIEKANSHFREWVQSVGKKWKGRKSPYHYGYRQPDWMNDAREALGKNDEEWFKAIKLRNL
jgi:hypothetical protein